jgi:DNA-binding helix-hairpin-helix protein with protein kinase domain
MADGAGRTGDLFARGAAIGRGGEGVVHEVSGRPDLAMKIYHEAVAPGKVEKLKALVARTDPTVAGYAAWPTSLVRDERGRIVGFVMPRVESARDINALYSPKARREHFPKADWRFLVRTAVNLAAAVANVHALGCVIGDVNQSSVLVRQDAQVVLIDCDSYQIEAGGRLFPCEVGVPMFTPPELLANADKAGPRTTNHDAFGLAILIFHLLFLGRHPFAGRSRSADDLPIEDAIKARAFAYAPNARLAPPPNTLQLDALPHDVQTLFRRTFETDSMRPDAAEWHAALQKLEASLTPCRRRPGHHFVDGRTCPWCEIETATGASLFATSAPGSDKRPLDHEGALADVTPLYRAILGIRVDAVPSVPLPSMLGAPAKPKPHLRPIRLVRSATPTAAILAGLFTLPFAMQGQDSFFGALILAGIAVAIVGFGLNTLTESVVERVRSAFEQDRTLWNAVEIEWNVVVDRHDLSARLDDLRSLYEDHRRLVMDTRRAMTEHESRRTARLQAVEADLRKRAQRIIIEHKLVGQTVPPDASLVVAYDVQQHEFLDRRLIAQANIQKIGAARAATLASYGIESAADLNRTTILAVPGFGEELATLLLNWRQQVAKSFVFDLTAALTDLKDGRLQPPPPKEAAPYKIDKRTVARLRSIEAKLLKAPAEISTLVRAREDALAKVRPLAIERATRMIQSRADMAALGLPEKRL